MNQQWKKDLQQKLSGYSEPAPPVSWTVLEEALSVVRRPAPYYPVRMRIALVAVLIAVAVVFGIHYVDVRMHPVRQPFITVLPPIALPAPDDGFPVLPLLADISRIIPAEQWERGVSGPIQPVEEEAFPDFTEPRKESPAAAESIKQALPKSKENVKTPVLTGPAKDTVLRREREVEKPLTQPSPISVKTYLFGTSCHKSVRLGVLFNYSINRKWSVESGFSYGCLRETMYLGVPFNLDYKVFDSGKFNLYTSVGGAVEKSINGRQVDAGESIQFSVKGALGTEYLMKDRIGLFIEPGLQYGFNFSDSPLDFSLNVGLRVAL